MWQILGLERIRVRGLAIRRFRNGTVDFTLPYELSTAFHSVLATLLRRCEARNLPRVTRNVCLMLRSIIIASNRHQSPPAEPFRCLRSSSSVTWTATSALQRPNDQGQLKLKQNPREIMSEVRLQVVACCTTHRSRSLTRKVNDFAHSC